MNKLCTALCFALIVLAGGDSIAASTKAKAQTPTFHNELETIARVEAYLTGIQTIVADFSQIAPDGTLTSGKFYLKRPGKMRWQYDPPTPILMISNGQFLTYYDYELEQVSDIPLDSTLAGFLAQATIKLSGAVEVVELREGAGSLRITVRQVADPENGTLTMEFADGPLELRNLILSDSIDQVTHISLSNVRFDQALEEGLFTFEDPRYRRKARRRG